MKSYNILYHVIGSEVKPSSYFSASRCCAAVCDNDNHADPTVQSNERCKNMQSTSWLANGGGASELPHTADRPITIPETPAEDPPGLTDPNLEEI
jgi:hypothetical protein